MPLWFRRCGVVASVAGLASMSLAAMLAAEEVEGPPGVKVSPVAVTWQYSSDGGQTFSDKPHPAPPGGNERTGLDENKTYRFAWKGTFEVADPSKVAVLWVRIAGEGDNPRSTICNGDLSSAAGGYWKDLGFAPTLLDAAITFNGKNVPIAYGPVLQFWVPLTGEILKGQNTVELRGHVYTYWGGAAWAGTVAKVNELGAKIVAAEPQPAAILNGPILGDFGDRYFTLACRTQLPADLTVEATPLEPAAPAVTTVSTARVWHRVTVQVPKGTRKVRYALTAKVGPHETKKGPFTVALPAGDTFRFVAFGGAMQQPGCDEPWATSARLILDSKADFAINTGNLMEQETWSFNFDKAYYAPASNLLAQLPELVTPCNRDFCGLFNELHVTPAPGGYNHNWSKVIGPVRFIGIDGHTDWSAGGQNAKWLEEELSGAKDKYIVVLSGYPGYSSGINSKRMYGPRVNARDVILPLLAKYKATVMLSSYDPDYERIEPPPDKGVTQIVTGCIGKGGWHKFDSRFGSHGLGPVGDANSRGTSGKVNLPDGREWVGYFGARHYCLFEVTENAMELKVVPCHKSADPSKLNLLDEKTFKPRQ